MHKFTKIIEKEELRITKEINLRSNGIGEDNLLWTIRFLFIIDNLWLNFLFSNLRSVSCGTFVPTSSSLGSHRAVYYFRANPFLLYSLSFFILHSPFFKFVPSLCCFFSFYERFDSKELWDNAVSRILWIAVLKIHVHTAFRRKIRLSLDLHWKSLLFIVPITFEFSNKLFYFTPLRRIFIRIITHYGHTCICARNGLFNYYNRSY